MPATLAPNNILLVEQQLWALALAWPGLNTVIAPATMVLMKPGNQVRYDQQAKLWPDFTRPRYNAADSVVFDLDVPFSGQPDPRLTFRTFCLQSDNNAMDFTWKLTASTRQLNAITQAHAELKACMMTAGMQLGLPAIVARWEQQFRPGKSAEVKDRQISWIQRITVRG